MCEPEKLSATSITQMFLCEHSGRGGGGLPVLLRGLSEAQPFLDGYEMMPLGARTHKGADLAGCKALLLSLQTQC